MKRVVICLAYACLVAFLSSCDSDYSKLAGEAVEVSAGIDVPDMTTRSGGCDAFSNLGGAYNVDPDKYDLRYVVEVWSEGDEPELLYREMKSVDRDFAVSKVSFSLRLLDLPCNLVFWADFVEEDSLDDLYYNTEDNLQSITYSEKVKSLSDLASDAADAYSTSVRVEQIDKSRDVTLTRPLGKLRFVSTDIIDGGEVDAVEPVKATVDLNEDSFPCSYNALTGKVSDVRTLSGKFEFNVIKENVAAGDEIYENANLLGFVYLFVSDMLPSFAADVTVTADEDFLMGTRSVSSVPVERNKLTTVIGNYYSGTVSLKVLADDIFDQEEKLTF